jgi:membrane fusion protein (multidrug efflux system)
VTAVLNQEKKNAKRMEMLAPSGAAAQSQLDIAIANVGQAEADVAARKADIARAKLNLEYASIGAPISGRIGRALVTEGALVGQNTPTHVATIQQLDPIYADFTQSAAELNELRREFDTGALQKDTTARVRLILDDGLPYPHDGKLLFSDSTVDPGTGQVTLRGEFPNPNLTLLPGMYVRVQIVQGIDPDALAVPQQAVRRNNAGGSEIFVVRDDNRASLVQVRLGHAIDDRWLILDGVKPGDRVIVDGFQKFADGDVVTPKLWREARQADQPSQSAGAEDVTKLTVAIDARLLCRSARLRLGRRPSDLPRRIARHPVPGGGPISDHRAAVDFDHHQLSRRLAREPLQQRHAADRGRAQWRQRHPQFRIHQRLARPSRNHRQFRSRHGYHDRFGRGAEPHQAR